MKQTIYLYLWLYLTLQDQVFRKPYKSFLVLNKYRSGTNMWPLPKSDMSVYGAKH